MIFLPSKAGRNHCPEDETDLEDTRTEAELLLNTELELAARDSACFPG
jgi:hypothetical protein